MPELMIMVKGMVAGTRSVCTTLVLLVGVIYVFALIFRQLTAGEEIGNQYFSSVPKAMLSLFLRGVIPDMSAFIEDVGSNHLAFGFLIVAFVLLATLMVLNMLIGVLVEVVDVLGLAELSDFIFQGDLGISFAQFYKLLLQLRGTNSATVRDIVDMRKYFSQELYAFEEGLFNRFKHLVGKRRGILAEPMSSATVSSTRMS